VIRRLLTCLLLVTVLLQGVTAAAAGVYESTDASLHCGDHHAAGPDCPCCSEAEMLAGACASTCSAMVAFPMLVTSVALAAPASPDVINDVSFLSAVHPPLDRPPIA
jgi:hypothetical protein